MDLWQIAVRVIVAYGYLLVMTRASGKTTVSQATPFDLVVSLVLGDLIDDALWAEVSVAKFAAAAATIIFCDVVVKLTSFHSRAFLRLVEGTPAAVLRDGHADGDELRREQLNEGDLEHLMRLNGIDRKQWKDVHLGMLERDHEVSVILQPGAEPAPKAMKDKLP